MIPYSCDWCKSPWFDCFCESDEGVPIWTRQSAHLGRGLRQPGQAMIYNTAQHINRDSGIWVSMTFSQDIRINDNHNKVMLKVMCLSSNTVFQYKIQRHTSLLLVTLWQLKIYQKQVLLCYLCSVWWIAVLCKFSWSCT